MRQKPLRILFIHHGKGLGGAPLSLLYLVRSLDRQKYEALVLFLHNSEVIEMFKKSGVKTLGPVNLMDFPHTKIWWLRWYHLGTLIKALLDTLKTIFVAAPRIYADYHPDIVHLNTSSLIGWALVAHRLNIPVMWHIREPLADGYFGLRKRLITSCVRRYATKIFPICHDNARPWQADTKTLVIYNAVDKKLFDPAQTVPDLFLQEHHLDAHTPKILYLGGISYEKGTHIILEIFKQLRSHLPHAQLIIAGTWQTTSSSWPKKIFPAAQFKNYVQNLRQSCGSSVITIGSCYQIPEAMAASSVVVFPATVGHFARPIIEAGFMKKPVIASNLAPLDELVLHQKTGFLINPWDTSGWVDALITILTDKKLAQNMGLDAHAWCTAQFNLEHHVNTLQNIYQQTLEPKGLQ
ncbi:MAG: glycosyltransferase family 4 protein [Candidatus Babeliales bacterium]|jgi:glycosyltransferase involved in cell wall biosynthesis